MVPKITDDTNTANKKTNIESIHEEKAQQIEIQRLKAEEEKLKDEEEKKKGRMN